MTVEESAPTDERVLEAALEAFAEHGFAGTSVREVARQLGVSHNLIPQRFGSKERLWYAAVDQGFGTLLSDLLPVVLEDEPDDVSRLRSWMVRFVEANAARPALLRIINREASSPGPRFDYLYEHYIEPVRQAGEAFLIDLHDRGLVSTRLGRARLLPHDPRGRWSDRLPGPRRPPRRRGAPRRRRPRSVVTRRRRWT